MAKSKRPQAKKPQSKSKQSSSTSKKWWDEKKSKVVRSLEKLAAIESRHERKITRPNKEVKHINRELRKLRNPIYEFNRQEKAIRGRGAKEKKEALRFLRDEYMKSIEKDVRDLASRRSDARSYVKIMDDIKKGRSDIRKEIKNIDKQLRETDKSRDNKKRNELLDRKEALIDLIDGILEATDQAKKAADFSGFKLYAGEGEDGFEPSQWMLNEDGSIQYVSIWEAKEHLIADLASGDFDWFIINDFMIAAVNEGAIEAEFDQMRYEIEGMIGSRETPRVAIYHNYPRRMAKYRAAM